METIGDDDVFIVSSSIPNNPTVDPFAIDYPNSSLTESSTQIIDLESLSSEGELCTESQPPIINQKTKSCLLESAQKQLEPEIIDIDVDETGLLAPSKSVIHSKGNSAVQETGGTLEDFEKKIVAHTYVLLPELRTNRSSTDKTGKFNSKSSSTPIDIKNLHHSIGFDLNIRISNTTTLATTSTELNSIPPMVSNIQYEQNIGKQQWINPQYNVCINVSNKSEQAAVLSRKENCDMEPVTTMTSEIEQHPYSNDSVLCAPSQENKNSSDTDSVDSEIMKLEAPTFEAFMEKTKSKTRYVKRVRSPKRHLIQKTIQITPDLNSNKRHRQVMYQCLRCSLVHNSLDSLRKEVCNYQTKPGEVVQANSRNMTVYSCGLCSFRCSKSYTLKQHRCIISLPSTASQEMHSDQKLMFCCALCSYKSTNFEFMKSHICRGNVDKYTVMGMTQSKNDQVYCCAVCLFKSTDSDLFNSHRCNINLEQPGNKLRKILLSNSEETCDQNSWGTNGLSVPRSSSIRNSTSKKRKVLKRPHKEMLSCAVCSSKISDIDALKSHICPDNKQRKLLKKKRIQRQTDLQTNMQTQSIPMYVCTICSYRNTNLNVMHSHMCSSKVSNCNIDSQNVLLTDQQQDFFASENSNLIQHSQQHQPLYCCIACTYRTSDMNAIGKHICPNFSSTANDNVLTEKVQTGTLQPLNMPLNFSPIYRCTQCFYQTSTEESMKTHNCTISQSKVAPNGTDCMHGVAMEYQSEKVQAAALQPFKDLQTNLPPNYYRIYHCTQCFFHTTVEEVMKTHNCAKTQPNVLKSDASNRTDYISSVVMEKEFIEYQSGNTLQPSKELQINLPIGCDRIYRCTQCFYQTSSEEVMKTHNCTVSQSKVLEPDALNKTDRINSVVMEYQSEKSQSATLQPSKELETNCPLSWNRLYQCTKCFYQTSIEQVMNTHDCTLSQAKVLEPVASSRTDCSSSVVMDKKLTEYQSPDTHNIKKTINPVGQPSSNKTKDSLKCDKCIFNSLFPELVRSHKCPATDNVSTTNTKSSSTNKNAKFSCLSCPFRTDNVAQANAHKCRKYYSNYKATSEKNLRKKICEKPGYCEICGYHYLTSSDLFAHLMEAHFSIRKLWSCALCSPPPHAIYFNCSEDLSTHYKMLHPKEPLPDKNRILYKCTFCSVIMEERAVKEHFGQHIRRHGSLIQAIIFQENFVEFFNQIQETRSNTYTDKEQIKCYICKRDIFFQGLKCDNSYCENWYHISCCKKYSDQLNPHDISDHPDWFCVQCNETETQHIKTAEENVETIDFCLKMSDKLLLKEIENQNKIVNEMKKIKDEKLATKEEFGRIKNFIANSKSDKINNPVVKSVCNIIEKFINAGVDD